MKSDENQISAKIPKTGRIGKFAKIIEKETNQDVLLKIMQDSDKYESFDYAEKVAWEKQFFESALEIPVEVELVQTVITGAESCEFIIHI